MKLLGLILSGVLVLAQGPSAWAGACEGRSNDFKEGAAGGLVANASAGNADYSAGYQYGIQLLDTYTRARSADAIDQAAEDCGGSLGRRASNGRRCIEEYDIGKRMSCSGQPETISDGNLQMQHCRHLGWWDGSAGNCPSSSGRRNAAPGVPTGGGDGDGDAGGDVIRGR